MHENVYICVDRRNKFSITFIYRITPYSISFYRVACNLRVYIILFLVYENRNKKNVQYNKEDPVIFDKSYVSANLKNDNIILYK